MKPRRTTNYELLGKDWATRAPVAQTLQSVRQPCLRTTATCAYTSAQVPFSGKYNPPRTSTSDTTSSINNVTAPLKPQRKRQITSCLARTGQHARPSRKHCKACVIHAHAPPPRARTRLHGFHSVGNSIQPVPVQSNNNLKQQRDGAREHLKKRQITSCLGRTGQHARPSCKHCKACAVHAHAPPPRARTRLHVFHLVGNSIQPVPVQ